MTIKTFALPLFNSKSRRLRTEVVGKTATTFAPAQRTIVTRKRRVALLLGVFTAVGSANGATYTVPSFTGAAIQATINQAHAAGSNNTVSLPAGQYSIGSQINVPCDNNLTITGPLTTPATAVLNASFSNVAIMGMWGCSGITVQYLQFKNTGGIHVGNGNASNITVTRSQFYGLPSAMGGTSSASAAIYVDGNLNTTLTKFVATWNTFGDASSCAAVFSSILDEGGYCAGIYLQPGIAVDNVIDYNVFNHVEEGLHIHQHCSGCAKGTNVSVTQNLQVQYNYFYNFHRIAIEIQAAVIGSSQIVSDNVLSQPLNPSWGTMFISDACCTSGRTYLNSAAPNPANVTEDNLMWTDKPQQVGQFTAPVIGIEFWGGAGSRAANNYAEGGFSNQIDWGYGVSPWYVSDNYLCGAHNNSFIEDEERSVSPQITGNTTSAVCQQQTSTSPSISPSSGAYGSPLNVSLSDSGRNTSIYYTTDGSTPVPGIGSTQRYTGPFSVALPSTVRAVGMWGVPPQPVSYPAPYGFVPSAVVSATFTPGSGNTQPSGVKLSGVAVSGSGHTLPQGSTMQLLATCLYSDGSSSNCNGVDAHGNGVSSWVASGGAVSVGASGVATGVSSGSVNVIARLAGVSSPGWAITVSPGSVSLSSVSLSNPGNVHSLNMGKSTQMMATCVYSDGSSTNCSTADSHGNAATDWTSSSAASVTLSTAGLASAVAPGSSNVTVSVAGVRSSAWSIAVSAPTLKSVVLGLAGAAGTLAVGASNQLVGSCSYSDGSTTNCAAGDANGNKVTSWLSSTPSVATVSNAGVVTGVAAGTTNLSATVKPGANASQWGTTDSNIVGYTYPGWANATYVVLGSQQGGYEGLTCSFYLPAGKLSTGSQYDCGLVPAPTPTTQGSAWQCWYTYTVTNANWPGGWITGPLTDCGNLAAGSAWWVSLVTNQVGQSPAGFYDCGGTCGGSAPTSGNGAYQYYYVSNPYGTRTGLITSMNPGPSRQASQYVTLSQPKVVSNAVALTVASSALSLSSVYLTGAGNINTLAKGRTLQFTAHGVYSDGSQSVLPDDKGNAVTLWNTTNHTVAKVSTLGHVTAMNVGTVSLTAHVGSLVSAPVTIVVTAVPTAPSPAKAPTVAMAKDSGSQTGATNIGQQSASSGATGQATGAGSQSGGQFLGPVPQGPADPMPDSFGGPLWILSAPSGGAASISEGHLFLGVPGGGNHEALPGQNGAVRVMQAAGGEDFDVSVKVESMLSAADANTSQGMMVENDDHNWITFSLETNGTSIGLSVNITSNDAVTPMLHDSELPQSGGPVYLRLTKSGAEYIAFYSSDGQSWVQVTTFSNGMKPSKVGLFAANHNDNSANTVPVVMSVGAFEVK